MTATITTARNMSCYQPTTSCFAIWSSDYANYITSSLKHLSNTQGGRRSLQALLLQAYAFYYLVTTECNSPRHAHGRTGRKMVVVLITRGRVHGRLVGDGFPVSSTVGCS